MMKIPFVDLKTQYQTVAAEVDGVIRKVIEDSAFIGGKYVKAFEKDFARFCDVKHCIGVANGTDALFISLKALGIGNGDEVITAANSFVATSEAVTATGARVIFADCRPDDYTIDVDRIEEKITPRTKAIIPVHLYGQPADMEAISDLLNHYPLYVVEDCAQAHGATWNQKKVGSFGDIACFSFYPGKNLGAYGDGGAIVTNNDELAIKCRMLANHGRVEKYNHEIEGYNSRLDGIQAGILSVKLNKLNDWNRKRLKVAENYTKELMGLKGIQTPVTLPHVESVYHLYVIRTNERERLQCFLNEKGICTGIHYPIGLPFLKAYQYLGHKFNDFPVTWKYQNEILSLPIFPELSMEQCGYVIENIKRFISNNEKATG